MTFTKSGTLKLPSIEPLIENGKLKIRFAELDSPHLINARIDSKEVKTNTLVVTGTSDMNGDVYVDGSINVRGSVIGSGPYIDTSDIRFKTNITTINNALNLVKELTGVTYDNRYDEFPKYNFDKKRQIGWIADDVLKVIPELVYIDSEGYKHVSYSRAVSLLGEAIKELSNKYENKIEEYERKLQKQNELFESLQNQINELKLKVEK